MIEQPDFIYDEGCNKIDLYQHQLKSVYDMEQLEKKEMKKTTTNSPYYHNRNQLSREFVTSIGLFRDPPGYGKTLSICTLIARDVRDNKIDWDLSTPFERKLYDQRSTAFLMTATLKYEKCDCSVVICSPNLIHQWKIELERCSLLYYEVNNHLSLTEIKSVDFLNENVHVIIVSTNFASEFFDKFGDFAFRRVIYDEIVDTKMKGSKRMSIIAYFYWCVSATIYRRLKFGCVPTVFGNLLPSNFGDYDLLSVMNELDYITMSILLPKPKYFQHLYFPNIIAESLGDFLDPRVTYLIKTGNIIEALGHLRAMDNENIFDVIIRNCDEKINRVRMMSPGPLRAERLLQATKTKENILARIDGLSEKECNICYTIPSESIISPCCYQVFCSECYLSALNSSRTFSCCFCRSKVEISKLIKIVPKECLPSQDQASSIVRNPNDKIRSIDGSRNQHDALRLLMKHLIEVGNRKILIFSEYDQLYEFVREKTLENFPHINVNILKGAQSTREKLIHDFRYGNLHILYLNSVVNASGINLPEATDIILCHSMAKNTKDQIVGRAVRIGCTHEVCVHELICDSVTRQI